MIPSKNRLWLLQYAVKSILVQANQDFEIIISDNASKEDYAGYVKSLDDPRIVYVRQQKPLPVSENWARALAIATGDYILMLGDDDALVPRFSEILMPHLSSAGPDVVYLGAYHYSYPGVQPAAPSGYFAKVRSEFLQGDPGPFCLTRTYAKELAASVLEFKHRFNYNAQHFLLRRSFLSRFSELGGTYQSPYPDFFAAVLIFFSAESILVLPEPSVVIGISPKSFGAYYFSLRQEEGYKFLDNEAVDVRVRDFVRRVQWPGDLNNTKWLISAEMARAALAPSSLPEVHVERYHAIQLISLLRDRYWHGKSVDKDIDEIRRHLSTVELAMFEFLCAALDLTAKHDKNVLVPWLQAAERHIAQYGNDYYTVVDIGAHKTVEDALAWLRDPNRLTPRNSLGQPREGALGKDDRLQSFPQTTAGRSSRGVLAAAPLRNGMRRSVGNIVRKAFPRSGNRIIALLKRRPVAVLRALVHRLKRAVAGGIEQADTAMPEMPTPSILVTRGSERALMSPGLFDDLDFKHGDQLTVVPSTIADKLLRTPDGHVHVRAVDGKSIRVPSKIELAEFMGYQLPEHLVRLTGAGSESLRELGEAHIQNYLKYVGLKAGMTFLEIGSGMGRDAFQLIGVLGPDGHYIGIDVQRESIVWCQKNITRDHPNFRFFHFDAVHELHNPYGVRRTTAFPLPAADRSVDRVALQSVLTHIFEDEIVHYLSEIARVLKPTGLAYVTFLLYSEKIVAASRRNNLTRYGLRFEHEYADGCYVDNAQYPTGGVAYTDEAMRRMISRAGLKLVRPYLKGQWSGYHETPDDDGQDVAILAPITA